MARNPEKNRDLILFTALRLFVDKGYFASSIHDISHAAGLSIGSIYHHFDSKESIASSIYDDLLGRMTSMVEDASGSHMTAKAKCRAII